MDIKSDLGNCISLHVTVTGSWYGKVITGVLAPTPLQQGWLWLQAEERTSWGNSLSMGAGKPFTSQDRNTQSTWPPGLESTAKLGVVVLKL